MKWRARPRRRRSFLANRTDQRIEPPVTTPSWPTVPIDEDLPVLTEFLAGGRPEGKIWTTPRCCRMPEKLSRTMHGSRRSPRSGAGAGTGYRQGASGLSRCRATGRNAGITGEAPISAGESATRGHRPSPAVITAAGTRTSRAVATRHPTHRLTVRGVFIDRPSAERQQPSSKTHWLDPV